MNLSPDMKEAFANARPQAQHSDLLFKTGPRPEERAEILSTWRRDIGRELSQDLSELLSGTKLAVTLSDPEMVTGSDALARIGKVGANCLIRCGKDDHTLLLSFSFATAIALTDRSFGGDGKIGSDEDAPEQLPRSAAMLTDSAAKIIAQAIARVSVGSEDTGGAGAERSLRADVIVRSESAARLKPFDPDAQCAAFTLECSEEEPSGSEPISWQALLVVTEDRLEKLLPGETVRPAESGEGLSAKQSGSFHSIPMQIEAVLSEFEMSLTKLERLNPGDCIPLAMPSEVPLRMGNEVLGHGGIGTLDNRMAVRLTRFSNSGVAA